MTRASKSVACIATALAVSVPASALGQDASLPEQAMLPSPATVYAAWDVDKSKTLSLGEFNAGWTRLEQAAATRLLKMQFDLRDKDRSGAIDPAEYAALDLVRKAGVSASPFVGFDADKSGGIDLKEYLAMVAALVGRGSAASTR